MLRLRRFIFGLAAETNQDANPGFAGLPEIGEDAQDCVLGISGSNGRDLGEKFRSSTWRTSGDW